MNTRDLLCDQSLATPSANEAIRRALADWFEHNRRDLPWRRTRDPYAIWISEVMLQQTQVKTVVPYFDRFIGQFPDLPGLAQADLQRVLKAWEGLGYYSRARNLHRAARIMVERGLDGLPRDRAAVRLLPGVGDYIAAAVLSIAFDQAYAVVDGNVKRVLARLLRLETPVSGPAGHKLFQQAADQLLDTCQPGRHNQAMMELGALVCTPRQPRCADCPLTEYCAAFKADLVDHYPRRGPKRGIGEQQWACALVLKNDRFLLTRRAGEGLLAGLWEFPGGRLCPEDEPAQACLRLIRESVGVQAAILCPAGMVRHTFTHFKLRLHLFVCRWVGGRVRRNGPDAHQWVHANQLDTFALHRAAHKAWPAMCARLDRLA